MNKALEQNYDGQIKMIKEILKIEFTGDTFEEKENFVNEHRPKLNRVVDSTLTSMFDIFTKKVKVFKLNDCDWVAAKSLKEATNWYRKNIDDSEDSIYDESEVEDLKAFKITLDKMSKDNPDYLFLGHLQEKYLVQQEDVTFKVPADELLAIEWQGIPFLFASTEY